MKRILKFKSNPRHYLAAACIIWCIDHRFTRALAAFVKAFKLTRHDRIRIAGGAKVFVSPEKKSDRDFAVREIQKSIKLHNPKKIILMTHEDCGAFGSSKRFKSRAAEKAFHERQLKKARLFLKRLFPLTPVEVVFVTFEDIWEI